MDSTARTNVPPTKRQHTRTTSSVIKSILPGNHQRKPTVTGAYYDWNEGDKNENDDEYLQNPTAPIDHTHTGQHLKEDSGNRSRRIASPMKSVDIQKENYQAMRENEGMASNMMFKPSLEIRQVKSPKKRPDKEEKPVKKSKSHTSLSALLSRPRSSKGLKDEHTRMKKHKENQPLVTTGDMGPPPIWAQFATQGIPEPPVTTRVPLNDRRSIDEEIRRYTPGLYSPTKQKNFQDCKRPTLSGRSTNKPRPKSECLVPRPTRESFTETVSTLQKYEQDKARHRLPIARQESALQAKSGHLKGHDLVPRPDIGHRKASDSNSNSEKTAAKRGSRVMAAVAAFNGCGKELPKEPTESLPSAELDPQAVETAFESLLEARNVPQNTRDKMRSLDTKIKADFISKDTFGSGSASSAEGLSLQSSRPNTGKRSMAEDCDITSGGNIEQPDIDEKSPKKSRPRSRTFTFSKGDQSPSKKQKAERPGVHQRSESSILTPSGSSKSLTSAGSSQGLTFFNRGSRPATPEDYIGYLQKTPQPGKVEVGKVHKLRQLLRNEAVGWVDNFVAQGGMTELVELLYRTIKVEWRAEHEDTLLHETLLCLKALSNTSSALQQFSQMHSTLFPTLLAMLFDKEKKGPSEFTTRGIVITLLYTYLSSCPSLDLASRARIIISYLRDPSAPEEAQAPEFITSIYHPRPYRIWYKELDNIVKEVFWIFLHHVNIIPYPEIPDSCHTYVERHFPREHPPVPAAPYIGGVEWDATNYLTAHIDLLNGLIASLPTRGERNQFRQELKDSSFEKLMGMSLRTCKEKFYGCVHEALSVWVGAAMEDEWPSFQDIRQGPPKLECKNVSGPGSPNKSPVKKKDMAPVLEMPRLDFGGGGEAGGGGGKGVIEDGGWL